MKKWLIFLVVILCLLFFIIFLFLPKKVNSSNNIKIHCSINAVNRFVMNENKWLKWWPGKVAPENASHKNIYVYDGYNYKISAFKYNAIQIQTQSGEGFTIDGTLFFIPLSIDSVQAEWKYTLTTKSNPVNRIHLYAVTKGINKNMHAILKNMQAFLDNPDSVYGMHINQAIVKDTILVTTRFSSAAYPSTAKIYSVIDGIKAYIKINNAIETNQPMLSILHDSVLYKTQIGIPVNKIIPQSKEYFTKRMVPGKILVSEIKGGDYRAKEALREMRLFMIDNAMSSPAIPFESLVTNRIQEPDTSKWITKIYYPVF